MKLFSPLVLLTVLFTSSFAAPTERALSKRLLTFDISLFNIANAGISLRDVDATVDEHRFSKRALYLDFDLLNIANLGITLKRGTEETDTELSKRSEVYTLVVTSLTSGSEPSRRSTDAYEGRHVSMAVSDAMVQGLQSIGVTRDKMPQYFSQAIHVTDPDTGYQYQLVPGGTASGDDIILNVDYEPTSQ